MTAFSTVLLLLLAEPAPNESVGFGEFSLRVGLGMTLLVVFIALCCLAWRTVPALKQIIPDFIASRSLARTGSALPDPKATTKSNAINRDRDS